MRRHVPSGLRGDIGQPGRGVPPLSPSRRIGIQRPQSDLEGITLLASLSRTVDAPVGQQGEIAARSVEADIGVCQSECFAGLPFAARRSTGTSRPSSAARPKRVLQSDDGRIGRDKLQFPIPSSFALPLLQSDHRQRDRIVPESIFKSTFCTAEIIDDGTTRQKKTSSSYLSQCVDV